MPDNDTGQSSRRNFLVAGVAGAAATTLPTAAFPIAAQPDTVDETGPQITESTLAEAEKLAAVEFTPKERKQILTDIGDEIQRHRGRRSVEMPNTLSPATTFDPRLGDMTVSIGDRFVRSNTPARPLPTSDESIAFESVTAMSRWIEQGMLTSEQLTRIYLKRLERIGPRLECTITMLGRTSILRDRGNEQEWRPPEPPSGSTAGCPWSWRAPDVRHRQ